MKVSRGLILIGSRVLMNDLRAVLPVCSCALCACVSVVAAHSLSCALPAVTCCSALLCAGAKSKISDAFLRGCSEAAPRRSKLVTRLLQGLESPRSRLVTRSLQGIALRGSSEALRACDEAPPRLLQGSESPQSRLVTRSLRGGALRGSSEAPPNS